MISTNDTCNEELGFAPQSFAELDFDSFLKEVTADDLFQTQTSVVPRLDTNLEDLAPVNITSLPSTLSYLPFDEESKLFDIPPLAPSLISDKPPQVLATIKQEPVDTKRSSSKQASTSRVVKKQRTSKDTQTQAQAQQVILQAPKKEEEEKYSKRLQANKKSAQASRERKKALKGELEVKLDSLTQENALLQTQLIQMETENRVLKNEFAQLQNVINESSIISKLMARQVAATLPMKMGKITPTATTTKTQSSPNVQAAAALYLMVVLHSFGQHLPSLPSLSNSITHIPNTVTVM